MRSVLAGLRDLVVPWGAPATSPAMEILTDPPAALETLNGATYQGGIIWRFNTGQSYHFYAMYTSEFINAIYRGVVDPGHGTRIFETITTKAGFSQVLEYGDSIADQVEQFRYRASVSAIYAGGGTQIDLGTWVDYGPAGTNTFVWAGSGGNPSLGVNAVITARYQYLNKHSVQLSVSVKPGAGDTKGAGNYTFTLPVAARDAGAGGAVGSAWINDSGAAFRTGALIATDTTHVAMFINGAGAQVSAATLTGAFVGSEVKMSFTYEV